MDDTNRISPYWDWQPAQEIPMSLQLSLVSLNHFLTFDKIILCRGFVITSKLWLVSCFICKNNSFIYFWFSFHCHFLDTSYCKILICQIVNHKNRRHWFSIWLNGYLLIESGVKLKVWQKLFWLGQTLNMYLHPDLKCIVTMSHGILARIW